MRTLAVAATALAAFALPAPLLAQDEPAPERLSEFADTMGDPERQREIALMLQTMTEVLLDLPLAPLAEAVTEATGGDPAEVDPDMTLRRLSPESDRLPEEVGENVPRAMDAMSGMATGFEAMLPALREMAARIEEALPETIE